MSVNSINENASEGKYNQAQITKICQSKKTFSTRKAARQFVCKGKRLKPYLCHTCSGYHLTERNTDNLRRANAKVVELEEQIVQLYDEVADLQVSVELQREVHFCELDDMVEIPYGQHG